MNGWISIIFSVLGGIALLMKSKTNENGGGGFTVIQDSDTPAPSPSAEDATEETIAISVQDVINDPLLLDALKTSDPDRYEEITRTIWQNPSYLRQYVRQSDWVDIDNKENEVMKVLEEGILKPYYVGNSLSGDYFIEVFVREDPNIGWENGEKVGIVMYEIIRKFPDQPIRMMRDYQMANLEEFQYEGQIDRFNSKYAVL